MAGKVDIINTGTAATITLDGNSGTITAGTNGANGIISLHDPSAISFWGVLINCQNRSFTINKMLTPNEQGAYPVVSMHGTSGKVGVGGNGVEGHIGIYPADRKGPQAHDDITKANVHLAGADGFIRLGGAGGAGGHLVLYAANAKPADLGDPSKAAIHLDGQAGDIILANADCAEEFEITGGPGDVEPGTVMVIGGDGGMQRSEEPYDRRVAGVISGANGLRPGIVLGKRVSGAGRYPIALAGQVYCKVDAAFSAIDIGDLLTTSPTPGHAMRACDPLRAFGAVIGKALSPLKTGRGLIRILVALQ